MPLSRLAAASFFASAAVFGSAACGDSTATNRDYGQPPDPSTFNPGSANADDPYGYGTKTGASKVECPAELKRCGATFTYPFTSETKVELRGDWDGQDTWDTGTPMVHDGALWTATVQVPVSKPVQYKFVVDGVWMPDPKQPIIEDKDHNKNNLFDGATCTAPTCEEDGELAPGVFDWRNSVIYFVFVDRFFNGKTANDHKVPGVSGPAADYQGGDWAGVTQKITEGYFTDLGVNTLWITVPFENPDVTGLGTGGDNHQYSGYHGYWPKVDSTDPTKIAQESTFGTLEELKTLVSTAHQKGLKVLLDYAMVHVHDSSGIYKAHQNDPGADDQRWFWPNSKNGQGDCVCGGATCTWEKDPQRCWFTSYLPHWNYTNKDARTWSVTQAVAWIKGTEDAAGNGADGFRADAIKHVDVSWLNDLRAKIKTDITAGQTPPQRFYMVGETFDFGNRDLIKSFIDPTTKLDGQFDFPLRADLVQAVLMRTENMSDLAAFMDKNDYFYGSKAVMSTFIGNHDLPRAIHLAQNSRPWNDQAFSGKDSDPSKDHSWNNLPSAPTELAAYERMANAYAVLFTNRGAPLVYYGDEIGMPGGGDPDNRRFMQWETPQLKYNDNQKYLRDRLKLLADIRSKHPALRRGVRSTIDSDADTWTYVRETTGDKVYVAVNRGDSPKQVSGLPAGALDDLVGATTANGPTVTIPARQTRIFVAK